MTAYVVHSAECTKIQAPAVDLTCAFYVKRRTSCAGCQGDGSRLDLASRIPVAEILHGETDPAGGLVHIKGRAWEQDA